MAFNLPRVGNLREVCLPRLYVYQLSVAKICGRPFVVRASVRGRTVVRLGGAEAPTTNLFAKICGRLFVVRTSVRGRTVVRLGGAEAPTTNPCGGDG
jgi:hypothetical protein